MRSSLATRLMALAAGVSAQPTLSKAPIHKPIERIDLGPRPGYLVDNMDDGPLKKKLTKCLDSEESMETSKWSIGHRGGGTMQFPEHSLESNMAGARMGAGILECDVAFTKDRQLVCRHSQCDLHFTTNIVTIPELNAKCTVPFTPAKDGKDATATCCTSDLTMDEFKTLCATMEGSNPAATTPEEFIDTPPSWRTDLYSKCGQVLSLQDHISLTTSLGLKHTPELKTPEVKMPFQGDYTQAIYAQQLVDEYKKAKVDPKDVYLQTFLYDDILYWLDNEPKFGSQAMYLDSNGETPETFPNAISNLTNYVNDGVNFIAPPLQYLVKAENGEIVPSEYAIQAKKLGLKIVPWTLERSGRLSEVKENGDYYYTSYADAVNNDGDVYKLLNVLWSKVGIFALFSDWSSTVTFFANCYKIGL